MTLAPKYSSNKSFHSGLMLLIKSNFFLREPPLICFSRAIAILISSPYSKNTSFVTLYFFVKAVLPSLCSSDASVEYSVMGVGHDVDAVLSFAHVVLRVSLPVSLRGALVATKQSPVTRGLLRYRSQ